MGVVVDDPFGVVGPSPLVVTDILTATNVDLSVAPYTGTITTTSDYLLATLKVGFSTTAARSITVSTGSRKLWTQTGNTDTDLLLDFRLLPFDSSETVTVAITQTGSACVMTSLIATIEQGSAILTGTTSVLAAGTAHVGSVNVDNTGSVIDANNSTTTPLLAGATFTGAATDLRAYAAVTVNIYADPDQMTTAPTWSFQLSPDGTHWDTVVPSIVPSGHIFIPVPLRPTLPFFRVTFTNGSTNQTALRLTTMLHTFVPNDLARTASQTIQPGDAVTLTRALIEPSFKGSISILGADRSIGHEAVVAPYIVVDRAQFDVPFANSAITPTVTGTGSATQAAATGGVIAVTGGGVGKANLTGSKKLHYVPGRESREEFSAAFPASCIASGNALVGMSDQPGTPLSGTANSLLVGYVGTTFGFHIVSGGVVTTIAKTAWNGDPFDGGGLSEFRSGGDPTPGDVTKGNAWRIRWVYYGIGPVYLEWKSPDDIWVVAHTHHYPNTATVPYIQNPNLFMCWDVRTTGTPLAMSLSTFSANCGVVTSENQYEPHEVGGHTQVQQAVTGITASGNTSLYAVPSGRQLFVKTVWVNLLTVSQHVSNALQITDGNGGTLLFALTGSTNNGSQVNQSISFDVPLVLTSGFVANLVVLGGSMSYDCGFTGYTKEA